MIDFSAFPKTFQLRDGRSIQVAPPTPSDQPAVMEFLARLPADEREYLWDDPFDPSVVRSWTQPIAASNLIPLAAWYEDKIVTVWTLGFGEHGWTRHLGYIWGIVEPSMRRCGLGAVIVRELLGLAAHVEMERVVLELVQPQKGPIAHFTNVGFKHAATLKEWVKDRQGRYHDLLVLTMELEPAWRKMDEMLVGFEAHGAG